MTYAGESNAKKLARLSMWRRLALALPNAPRSLIVTGPDAGDVRCLRGLGKKIDRVVGVDIDPDAVSAAKRAVPGIDVITGDLLDAAKSMRRRCDVVAADLCSTINDRSLELCFRSASHALVDGGLLFVGFMYGRDKTILSQYGNRLSADLATCSAEERKQADALAEKMGGSMLRAYALLARAESASRKYGRRFNVFPAMVAYRSARPGNPVGTPMVYMSFIVGKNVPSWIPRGGWNASLRIPEGHAREGTFRDIVVRTARKSGTRVAADLFCLPPARVAAWLAVSTRRAA